MQKLTVHLISDSSDQVVKYSTRAALARFSNIKTKEYYWPMIRSERLLENVLNKIKNKPGVICYTLSDSRLRTILKEFALRIKVPCISVISRIVNEISAFTGIKPAGEVEYSYNFDESYFDKLSAIDYTLRHDDGLLVNDIEAADIVLIGPSRTSKTPTSVYLAYNGFKTANIPYIHGCDIPDILERVQHPFIAGLVINPDRLIEIREARMSLFNLNEHNNYTDINIIQQECSAVKRLCQKQGWPVIDVSQKSIEETSALIIRFYYDFKRNKHIYSV